MTEKKKGVYNYANGFFLSLVRRASMDEEIHEQSHACAQHITSNWKHTSDQYMNVS